MAKADETDIQGLQDDILDCIEGSVAAIDFEALKNLLRLALEAEYSVGYEDGQTDQRNADLDVISYSSWR